MGLLINENCISTKQLCNIKNKIKKQGVIQFIRYFKKYRSLEYEKNSEETEWGFEMEFNILKKDENNIYKLFLGSEKILKDNADDLQLMPEFARYMLEIIPEKPFLYKNLENLEDEILKTYKKVEDILEKFNSKPLFLSTIFFNLKENFLDSDGKFLTFEKTLSKNFPDNAITKHNRFISFVENIRNLRGSNVGGEIETIDNKSLFIDSMGEGMGCSCLHVTISMKNMTEALFLYDQFMVLGPLILFISQASPILDNKILKTNTRWDLVKFSVDDRNEKERNFKNNKSPEIFEEEKSIKNSRFRENEIYISEKMKNKEFFNDRGVLVNKYFTDMMIKNGVPSLLSNMISSEFVNDPVLLYESSYEKIKKQKDCIEDLRIFKGFKYEKTNKKNFFYENEIISDLHDLSYKEFENIHSSIWKPIRLKIPLDGISWKIEFRTTEIQLTAFENSAFCSFIILLYRVIIKNNLNLYIPISLLDFNYNQANCENICKNNLEKIFKKFNIQVDGKESIKGFFYKKNIKNSECKEISYGNIYDSFHKTGLLGIVKKEAEKLGKNVLNRVLFIENRMKGGILSLSGFMRKRFEGKVEITKTESNNLIEYLLEKQSQNDYSYLNE